MQTAQGMLRGDKYRTTPQVMMITIVSCLLQIAEWLLESLLTQ